MSRDFTEFVRLLAGQNEPPGEEAFHKVWAALRRALRSELRRRGVWQLPPHFLGVYGWESWSARQAESDALEELTADCYEYVFLTRAQSLSAQIRVKPTIEGLVFRSIRNFLYERQKRCDPIGFKTFEVARDAVRTGIADEWLFVLAGDARVRNDTLLGFAPDHATGSPTSELPAGSASEWAAELLPELVVGGHRREVVRRLTERLRRLPEAGVECLAFQTLVDPLKSAVRAAWSHLFDTSLGEAVREPDPEGMLRVVRLVQPESDWQARRDYVGLADQVTRQLEGLELDGRTLDYLGRLWGFLVAWSAPGAESGDRLPSGRRLAAQLAVPRERLPGLFDRLGELVRASLATDSAGREVTSERGEEIR